MVLLCLFTLFFSIPPPSCVVCAFITWYIWKMKKQGCTSFCMHKGSEIKIKELEGLLGIICGLKSFYFVYSRYTDILGGTTQHSIDIPVVVLS